jgi:endonuclease YncB( thermonuclease family)
MLNNRVIISLICFLALTPLCAEARKAIYGTATVKEIISIYDGDTFRVNLEGYPPIIGNNISIRINGIDTPEMKDKRPEVKALARKAKQFVVKRLSEGQVIELRNMQRGKYFRIVADVFIDGVSLGDELIKAGLAKPYDGGRKPEWTTGDNIILNTPNGLLEIKDINN